MCRHKHTLTHIHAHTHTHTHTHNKHKMTEAATKKKSVPGPGETRCVVVGWETAGLWRDSTKATWIAQRAFFSPPPLAWEAFLLRVVSVCDWPPGGGIAGMLLSTWSSFCIDQTIETERNKWQSRNKTEAGKIMKRG